VEIPLPNELARLDILKIHARKITTKGDVDFEGVAKLAEEFNGADLRNICTEAGIVIYKVNTFFKVCLQ
jgi:26S proteasome regulatory subunit T4